LEQNNLLILDGEELVGAKQNRIVNTTILIPAKKTVVIPVSCVEEGRWSYDTERFHSEERIMAPMMRAMKTRQVNYSVRESGNFRSDQSAIWDEISAKASRRDAESNSMAMAEIYKKERPQDTRSQDSIDSPNTSFQQDIYFGPNMDIRFYLYEDLIVYCFSCG
jgi:hypothetical protein